MPGCASASWVPWTYAPTTAPPSTPAAPAQRLIDGLYGTEPPGGAANALTVYEEARRTLADELGADPSPELAALHLELLRGTELERPRLPVQPGRRHQAAGVPFLETGRE